ncbi:MAG: hypothetical protein J6031_02085 [Bacteroidales bacterium]|nr:hypothetical protein [Bacteroidales bacterium]
MKSNIVVFGGVHIDIWADYDASCKNNLDQIGNLLYSIGGTGYNIAYLLSKHGVKTTFFSILNANSYNTIWIKRELASTKIKTIFQIEKNTFVENGFVAIRNNGILERAITSSYLSKAELDVKKIEKALGTCNLAVIDCNFETHQIFTIVQACLRKNLKICFAATSDSKVRRIIPILDNVHINAVVMNEIEAMKFFQTDNVDSVTPDQISKNLDYCIVTLAERGHYIFHNGERQHYPAPNVAEVVSSSGCGDALFSAVAKTISEENFSVVKCNARIYKYVGESLTQNTTYLKPTKRKVPRKIVFFWGVVVSACIMAIALSFILKQFELGMIFTIIGTIFAFAQSIRSEIRD